MIDKAFEEWYDSAFKEEKIAISFIKYLKSKIEARIKELENALKELQETIRKRHPDSIPALIHAAQLTDSALEEKKQILYLLGPVGLAFLF